jgi:ALG3 protein
MYNHTSGLPLLTITTAHPLKVSRVLPELEPSDAPAALHVFPLIGVLISFAPPRQPPREDVPQHNRQLHQGPFDYPKAPVQHGQMSQSLLGRLHNLQTTIMALDRPSTPTTPARPARLYSHLSAVDFYFRHWSAILLCIELVLNLYFLHHGPLHPIDYPTYLIQARQIRLGEKNYAKVSGPTGPLVYPGSHVIIFSLFERLFGVKGDPGWGGYLPAQWTFLVLQLVHTYVLFYCMNEKD